MPAVLDARAATDHFPGIGRYVVNLARAIARVAPDFDLALLVDPTAHANLTLPALPSHPCSATPFSLRQQWEVPLRLRRLKASLYHSPYYLMPYLPGVPTAVTCYDLIPLLFPAYFPAHQRLIYRVAHRLAVRASGAVLCISEATRNDLARCLPVSPARLRVTPLAADPAFRPVGAAPVAALRQAAGLPDNYLLYVGSNKPHKNLPRLVSAFSALTGTVDDLDGISLVIAGLWDARYPEAQRRAEELGLGKRVRFLGPIGESDLPALYSGAAAFVFPSLYEGFGLPVLEAMACGTPVACSQAPALREVAGDAALFFDPSAEESLADALRRLLGDAGLRQELRRRGLSQAGRFSWEATARATLAAYEVASLAAPARVQAAP